MMRDSHIYSLFDGYRHARLKLKNQMLRKYRDL